MKKAGCSFILLILLCCMLFCTGCTGATVSRENDIDEELVVVGFSQVGSESDWRLANTASMISALSEENGYRLLFDNAKQKQENQYRAIRNLSSRMWIILSWRLFPKPAGTVFFAKRGQPVFP